MSKTHVEPSQFETSQTWMKIAMKWDEKSFTSKKSFKFMDECRNI
jgi:hypothetical protein